MKPIGLAEAKPCPCGHPTCKDWLIYPWFALQGVGVDKETADEIVRRLNGWILMSDAKPEPGQLCVIQFKAESGPLLLCRYDNEATWRARNEDTFDEAEADEIDFAHGTWFTENDDEDDWWQEKHVRAWTAVPTEVAR